MSLALRCEAFAEADMRDADRGPDYKCWPLWLLVCFPRDLDRGLPPDIVEDDTREQNVSKRSSGVNV